MVESSNWASLREALVKQAAFNSHAIHLVRVENMVGSGVFDTNLCYRGVDCWLEGKKVDCFPLKATTLFKIGFSEDQRTFAVRRLLAGGKLFVWVHVNAPNRKGTGRGWYLFPLTTVQQIDDARMGISQAYAACCYYKSAQRLSEKFLEILNNDP